MAFLLEPSSQNPAQFLNCPYKIITVLQPVFDEKAYGIFEQTWNYIS